MKLNDFPAGQQKALLHAIKRLKQNAFFETVTEAFEYQQVKVDKSLRTAQDNVRELQGQAKVLDGFLTLVQEVDALGEKIFPKT